LLFGDGKITDPAETISPVFRQNRLQSIKPASPSPQGYDFYNLSRTPAGASRGAGRTIAKLKVACYGVGSGAAADY